MPPAARITDMHVCPKVEPGPVPHVGGPTTSGEPTVLIGFQPAARVGDSLLCVGPGVMDSIAQGEPTVIIGGKQAARLGDGTSHGGVLIAGCPTVIIGSSAQAQTIILATQSGLPFCEECEKKKASAALPPTSSDPAPLTNTASGGGPVALSAVPLAQPLRTTMPRVHWRQALGKAADAVLDFVMARSRSTAEAFGELALEIAKKRLEIHDDPRFISRYHGNDGIGRDHDNKLVGLEAKGSADDGTALSVRSDGSKQLSSRANRQTARKMLNKKSKIGKPSGRQGGPYTSDEINLYEEIDENEGQKKLVSSHANTETGRVRVLQRNSVGDIQGEPLDEFMLEAPEELKQQFMKRYGK